MRLSTIAATTLCLGYHAVAVSLPEREALPLWGENPYSSDNLAKRLTIEEQAAILNAGGLILLNINAIATYISNLMKAQSEANSCGVLSGTLDGINYQYHAATTGKKCDTTAEVKTMNNAVKRALEFMQTHNINQACFNMQHGGTWRGLLQLAGGGRTIINDKCDSVTYTLTVT